VVGDFRVGLWLVEPSLNTVSRNGTRVRLEPKLMEVLVCLAQHPGEAVSKEKLMQSAWSDTFVSEDVLTRSISELRRIFEDDAKHAHFIETIPKRGYRLVASVTAVNGAVLASASPQTPADISGFRTDSIRWRAAKATLLAAVPLLALLVGFNVGGLRDRLSLRTSAPTIQSLAVLPLQNLSGDPAQEYFADGMTEELITELSRLHGLKVISRTSVMRYKNSNKSLPEIARELNVDGIVEGSVLRSGDRVRITAQLIRARTDVNLWAGTYDRDLHDVLALQSAVASTIANELRARMTPGEQAQLRSWRPVNLKAHEAYLQGLYHLQLEQDATFKKDKSKLAADEDQKAEDFFHQAIQEDPNYAPSYLGIWKVLQNTPLPGRDWAPQAKPLVLKALQLDDSLAEAHRALANLLSVYDWDFPGAEREYQRALQLAPSDADAHADYATFLAAALGRSQDAFKEFERAQNLDPNNDHMAYAFYFTRQFDRAIELYQIQAQSRPSDSFPHMLLANVYALTGRQQQAISEWQKTATLLEYTAMSDAIGSAYRSGGYHKALRVLARALQASQQRSFVPSSLIASIYGYMGDRDQAFAWLEKAYEARDNVDTLRDPIYDPIRSDPRFEDLVRRVGLPPLESVPTS
jgi:TolB-like protein/DNA-binding winged helix-turn-helix (wHTH) protein/Flp pilus assembly protein TadD